MVPSGSQISLEHARVVYGLGIAASTLFIFTDFFAVIGPLWPLLVLRAVLTAFFGVALALTYGPRADRRQSIVLHTGMYIGIFSIAGFVTKTGGVESEYYQAYFLIIFSVAILRIVSVAGASIIYMTVILSYDLSLILTAQVEPLGTVIGNNTMLFIGAGAGLVTLHTLQRATLRERTARSELEAMAQKDFLTGLSNRRYFTEVAQRELESAGDNGSMTAFVLFDVDHFKQVNDSFGHLIGDRVLTLVARAIEANIRPGDVAARYGGEEFIVLLRNADPAATHVVAERIREAVQQVELVVRGKRVAITISAGVSLARPHSQLTDAVDASDQALYRAKSTGRNRVVTAGTN